MHQDEYLITPSLLDEADAAFRSTFKPVVGYEKTITLSLTTTSPFRYSASPATYASAAPPTKRTLNSILAEIFLCKQLGWELLVDDLADSHKFHELSAVIKPIHEIFEQKFALLVRPLSRQEIDTFAPHVQTLCADIKTPNKGIQKRILSQSITPYLTMFSDARTFDKRILVTLGVGEHLDDLKELHRFIATHNITQVTFVPAIPDDQSFARHRPSSFYCARWIAETRVAFPQLKLLSAIWPDRVAELGLFLRAGINTITGFPAFELFHSEAAHILEEECKTADRVLQGTLTDVGVLDRIADANLQADVKEKLSKYLETIRKPK